MSTAPPAPSISTFRGFRCPTYTIVPDELFDELLVELSGAELKVLLFIIRRTFGFKRDRDPISLSQMLHGITTGDGRTLHRGVGLSKPTLLQALRSLQEQQVIVAERRCSQHRGHEPTIYALKFVPAPHGSPLGEAGLPRLVRKVDQGAGQAAAPRARSGRLTTQQTAREQTEETERQQQQPQPFTPTPAQAGSTADDTDVVVASSLRVEDDGEHADHNSGQAAAAEQERPTAMSEEADVVAVLIEQGVTSGVASRLLETKGEAAIRAQLDYAPYRREMTRNPAGALRRAIEQDWAPPKAWLDRKNREAADARRQEETRPLAATETAPIGPARAAAAAAAPPEPTGIWGDLAHALRARLSGATYAAFVTPILQSAPDVPADSRTLTLPLHSAFAFEKWHRPPIRTALAEAAAALGIEVVLEASPVSAA